MRETTLASNIVARPVAERIIPIAQIVAVHGLRGWVKLQPEVNYDVLTFCPDWNLRLVKGKWRQIRPERCRHAHTRVLVKFPGSDTRTQAQQLIGAHIGIERSKMPKLEAENYYWCDLIGLEVIGNENITLGRVQNMQSTPANDIMEVGDQENIMLIPFTPDYVTRVDFAQGKIITRWRAEY